MNVIACRVLLTSNNIGLFSVIFYFLMVVVGCFLLLFVYSLLVLCTKQLVDNNSNDNHADNSY